MKDDLNAEIKRLRTEMEQQRRKYEEVLRQHDEDRGALLNILEDLKEGHDQIERARKEWNDAFDAVTDPILIHDKEYRIVRANLAYAKAGDKAIRDIIGKPYWQVFPKRDGPLSSCSNILEKREIETKEEITLNSGKTYISRGYAIKDKQDQYLYSIHIFDDVTESRRIKQSLTESEEVFRSISTAAQDAVIMLDDNDRVVYWNPAAEHILGYSAEEISNRELHTLLAPVRYQEDFRRGWSQFRVSGKGPIVGKVIELTALRSDGTEFPIDLSVSAIKLKEKWHAVGILRDITERKQAEESLYLAMSLVANSPTILFRWKAEEKWPVEYVSENVERLFGYTPDELISGQILYADIVHPDDLERVTREVSQHSEAGDQRFTQDYRVLTKNGGIRWVDDRTIVDCDGNGNINFYEGVVVDVTEKQLAEVKEKEATNTVRTILETIPDMVWLKDQDGTYLACNPTFERFFGASQEEIVGKTDHDFVDHKLAEFFRQKDREAIAANRPTINEEWITFADDGHRAFVETIKTPIHYDGGRLIGVLGIARDITARMKAEEALHYSEKSLKEAQRIANIGSWELNIVNNTLTWSDEIYRIFEIDPKEFAATYEAFLGAVHPEDQQAVEHAYNEHLKKHVPYSIEHRLLFNDGRIKYVHERCETTYAKDVPQRSIGTVQDITTQKLADLALHRVNRTLRTLSAGNEVLVFASDEAALLHKMCHIIVEQGDYRFAWIGFLEHGENKSVQPVAYSGYEDGYLESILITIVDNEHGQGPAGRAIRLGTPQLAKNILTDPQFSPWREAAQKRGYASSIALPLKDEDGEVFGVLCIYAAMTDAFDDDEIHLLQELASDLAYGIINLRVRVEQDHSAERLRESLVDTIRAIAITVEKRDPYTSGHQQRVAELCVGIGNELGLGTERIEGLRLGAMIHDIGKIYIPAEILNRPGKLSDPEFEMIKSHTLVGYDIVKDVNFPWPVAEMILQHHERMDGSGYPNGLKGEAIILEARILAVADVVEAITSHRPYRAGLGIDVALSEIEAKRGQLYEASIVDACLRLFREKGYRIAKS